MTRQTLPTRRPSITVETSWQGQPLAVTVGFDPESGEPMEAFADARAASGRHGQIGEILRDASTAISVALQYGTPPAAMAKSLGTSPLWQIVDGEMLETEAPSSPLGPILKAIMEASQ